jgi:hypothetical protein
MLTCANIQIRQILLNDKFIYDQEVSILLACMYNGSRDEGEMWKTSAKESQLCIYNTANRGELQLARQAST